MSPSAHSPELPAKTGPSLASFSEIIDIGKLSQPKIFPWPGCRWYSTLSSPVGSPNRISLSVPAGKNFSLTHELFNRSFPPLLEAYTSKFQSDPLAYQQFSSKFSALPLFFCHFFLDFKDLTFTSEMDPILPLQNLLIDRWAELDQFEKDSTAHTMWLFQKLSKHPNPKVRSSDASLFREIQYLFPQFPLLIASSSNPLSYQWIWDSTTTGDRLDPNITNFDKVLKTFSASSRCLVYHNQTWGIFSMSESLFHEFQSSLILNLQSMQQVIASAISLLHQQISTLPPDVTSFSFQPVDADGNCFFSAITGVSRSQDKSIRDQFVSAWDSIKDELRETYIHNSDSNMVDNTAYFDRDFAEGRNSFLQDKHWNFAAMDYAPLLFHRSWGFDVYISTGLVIRLGLHLFIL
jgi:hypothetical protein